MYDFEFLKPASLDDAVAALAEEGAQALAGGQTLIPTLKARLAMPSALISLDGVEELRGICSDDQGRICIGAMTTHGRDCPGDVRQGGRGGASGRRNRRSGGTQSRDNRWLTGEQRSGGVLACGRSGVRGDHPNECSRDRGG